MRFIASTSAVVVAAALLAACGGGGGTSAGPIPNQSLPATQSTQSLGITFAGTQTLAKVRRTQDLASVPVTVSVGGVVVGTGTLDGNGHAKITFTAAVAPGSTITIVAGKVTVTATLAMGTQATAVLITINADGTISVKSAGDRDGNGMVDPNDDEQEDATEDDHGNVSSVNAGSGNVLPANAPFTLTRTCTTLTLTPVGTAVASIKFEEKGSDGESDDAGRVRFEGAFTGPLTFPISAASARLHIELFDAQHRRLIEVKAPISAFTSGTATSPSPCPSPSTTPSASPRPSASPGPSASPQPSPSPKPSESPEPSESPHASPSPTATPAGR
jgi:hypothetical protein